MAELIIVKEQEIVEVADAIREKTGKTEQMYISQMAAEIKSITGGTAVELPTAEGVAF